MKKILPFVFLDLLMLCDCYSMMMDDITSINYSRICRRTIGLLEKATHSNMRQSMMENMKSIALDLPSHSATPQISRLKTFLPKTIEFLHEYFPDPISPNDISDDRDYYIRNLTKDLGGGVCALLPGEKVVHTAYGASMLSYVPEWFVKLRIKNQKNNFADAKSLLAKIDVRKARVVKLYEETDIAADGKEERTGLRLQDDFGDVPLLLQAVKLYADGANDKLIDLLQITNNSTHANVLQIFNSGGSNWNMRQLIVGMSPECMSHFSGKALYALQIVKLTGGTTSPLLKTLFSSISNNVHLKENCFTGENIIEKLSIGNACPIHLSPTTQHQIDVGNDYIYNIFWDTMNIVAGYNGYKSTTFLADFLSEVTNNEPFTFMKSSVSIVIEGRRSLANALLVAYAKMTKMEAEACQALNFETYYGDCGANGACGAGFLLQHVRYVFSATRRKLDEIKVQKDLVETGGVVANIAAAIKSIEDNLTLVAKIMGTLIQAYNHCPAGINQGLLSCTNGLLAHENLAGYSWKDRLKATVTSVINEVKDRLFKFKRKKGDYLTIDEDGGIADADIEVDGEISMVNVGVGQLLDGMYGIDKAAGNNYYRGTFGADPDCRQSLLIHLLNRKKEDNIVRKAWQSLANNPVTAQWGPGGAMEFGWYQTNLKTHNDIPKLYEDIWTRQYQLYNVVVNPRYHAYDLYSMKDYEYKEVACQLLRGVLGDTDFFVKLILENPLANLTLDKYLADNNAGNLKNAIKDDNATKKAFILEMLESEHMLTH
ncbi:hypothetical protein FACS1894122_08740 [Alphaproteobacteria bacterium]|nr:hypothetical protein FACS1894122_08740 [Alphaproteobacteria bacterium]